MAQNTLAGQSELGKTEIAREMPVVSTERKDLESILTGMREIFTALINQNKRDYDSQLADLKAIFTSILSETRRTFQEQIQTFYAQLPKLAKNIEPLNVSGEEQLPQIPVQRKLSEVEELNRIESIKEMILGEEINSLKMTLRALKTEADSFLSDGEQSIQTLFQEFTEAFRIIEENMVDATNLLVERIQSEIEKWESRQLPRSLISQIFTHTATQISPA
jgi:hypothetical protein